MKKKKKKNKKLTQQSVFLTQCPAPHFLFFLRIYVTSHLNIFLMNKRTASEPMRHGKLSCLKRKGWTNDKNFWMDSVERIHSRRKCLNGCSWTDECLTNIFEWMKKIFMDEEIFEQLAVIYKVFLASKSWSKFTAWARYLQLSIQKQQTVRNVLAWEVPYDKSFF